MSNAQLVEMILWLSAVGCVAVAIKETLRNRQAIYELSSLVRTLGHRIEDEAFVCGKTDASGSQTMLYATSNPHEALSWLVGERNKRIDELMASGRGSEIDRLPGVQKEGDYDRMTFQIGPAAAHLWVERVGVLG